MRFRRLIVAVLAAVLAGVVLSPVAVFGVPLAALAMSADSVVMESGSMMHRDDESSFGRYGTIDPGDIIKLERVEGPSDVTTWADVGRDRFGAPGDVIVYYPANNQAHFLIIHRAMAWVDVVDDPAADTGYRVRWNAESACPASATRSGDGAHCEWGPEGITVNEFGVFNYKPTMDGFITKGDNPFSNPRADQTSGLSPIVKPDWIQGKVRSELPWLGLIELALSDTPNEPNPPAGWENVGNAWAPADLWTMLWVTVVAIALVPPLLAFTLVFIVYRPKRGMA